MKVLITTLNQEKFPDPVFPLGASYIAFSAKQAGYDVTVFDACFCENPQEELKNILLKEKPEVIGISIRNVDNNSFPIAINYLNYYKAMFEVCRINSNVKIVLGGSGFSIFPELFMNELSPDFGIKGEGEHAFIELLDNISRRNIPENKLFFPNLDKKY